MISLKILLNRNLFSILSPIRPKLRRRIKNRARMRRLRILGGLILIMMTVMGQVWMTGTRPFMRS